MSRVEFEGVPVLSLSLTMPLRGVWCADFALLTSDLESLPKSGQLTCNEKSLQCTVRRAGVYLDTVTVRAVGGAGGLGSDGPVASYNQAQASVVCDAILKQAGETLAPTSNRQALALYFQAYSLHKMTCGAQLAGLADAIDCSWRITDDGLVWVGKESWQAANVESIVQSQSPFLASVTSHVDGLDVRPGTVVDGRRIGYVQFVLDGHGRLTATTWEAP